MSHGMKRNNMLGRDALKNIAEEFTSLANDIQNLPDLSPSGGYSPLGHKFCDLVYQGCSEEEAQTILQQLRPEVIQTLQHASIHSEMKLEHHILQTLPSLAPLSKTQKTPFQKFQYLIQKYPYSWSFSRAKGDLKLLHAGVPDTKTKPSHFIYHGRSMLPLSALSMYFHSGAKVSLIDPFSESREQAALFLQLLKEQKIIPEDACSIYPSYHALQDTFSTQPDTLPILYILDTDYSVPDLLKQAYEDGIETLLSNDVHGLARLMYPEMPLPQFKKKYQKMAAIIPPHVTAPCAVTTQEIQLQHTSQDVFISTFLWRKCSE